MKHVLATALVAGMALLGAGAAHADAITQTFTFSTLSGHTSENGPTLSGFNSTLGILTSVSISDSVTATWSGGIPTDANSAQYDISAGPEILTLGTFHVGDGSDSDSGNLTITDPADLAGFIGGSQGTSVVVTCCVGTPASISSVFGTGTLTYNYTPATSVPEPGSLALLGTALIGLGAFGWSRRRRT